LIGRGPHSARAIAARIDYDAARMWTEYKKRFWTSQIMIVVVTILAWQVLHVKGQQLIMIVLAMELGALLGAWMGAKMKRQIERMDDDLPLKPQ
jgi:hypothetical protein